MLIGGIMLLFYKEIFPSSHIPTLSRTNDEAKERPPARPRGTLAGTTERDVVVLRGVARGV